MDIARAAVANKPKRLRASRAARAKGATRRRDKVSGKKRVAGTGSPTAVTPAKRTNRRNNNNNPAHSDDEAEEEQTPPAKETSVIVIDSSGALACFLTATLADPALTLRTTSHR
jgi:hypothetical protein